jgi:hypothetical protein
MTIMNINDIVIAAQRAQLEKPTRACVNSEAAFVADRLRAQGFNELAKQYWNFVCGGKDPGFSDEVKENEKKLKEIDKGFTMPDWGTYGT